MTFKQGCGLFVAVFLGVFTGLALLEYFGVVSVVLP